MFQTHKKLIFSQIAALLGVASLALGWLRQEQTGTWGDQMAGSFLLFAALLFMAEIKFLLDWVRERKKARELAEQ